jgi:hypothetical protein
VLDAMHASPAVTLQLSAALLLTCVLLLLGVGAAVLAVAPSRCCSPPSRRARVDAFTVQSAATLALAVGEPCPRPSLLRKRRYLHGSGRDPWGRDFVVACRGNDVRVTSVGADGRLGMPDDIVVE